MSSTWNLESYTRKFSNQDAIETELARLKSETDAFRTSWSTRTSEFSNPQILKQAIDAYEAWSTACGNCGALGYYAWLEMQLDSTSNDNKARYAKVMQVATELGNSVQFFTLALGKLSTDDQTRLLADESLAEYHHFLARIFESAKHHLSEEAERILNLKSTTAYERWVQLLSDRLDQESRTVLTEDGEVEKPFNDIFGLLQSTNEAVRDSAAAAITSVLDQYAPIAEVELNAVLQDKKVNDDLRGFTRPDAARHHSDDVSSEVVDAMMSAVAEYNSIAHDLYALKAELLGKSSLKYHERNVPIGTVEKAYPFEDAATLVSETLHSIDTEFGDIFDMFTREGRIDVLPRKGKSGGAFCVYWNIAEPVYVLLNHTGKLTDVLTIAHEMGHAINDEMMRKAQRELYFSTSLATAEVASTFMEDFVLERLLADADDELRLSLAMKRLDDDISTIHRQVACYQFERSLHDAIRSESYLSRERIGELFTSAMQTYMGSAVEQPAWAADWWIYWSHIRRYFYVYSYASGLIISKSMQAMVRADRSNIALVKQFLSAGASKSPQDLFADMGIDITDTAFWKQGLESIRMHLEETRELAKRMGKM
jgi:oligoendopeptidase F